MFEKFRNNSNAVEANCIDGYCRIFTKKLFQWLSDAFFSRCVNSTQNKTSSIKVYLKLFYIRHKL